MLEVQRARDWFVQGRDLGSGTIPLVDFQTHTAWSDGAASVGEMIAAAEAQGLAAIAFTEHVNAGSAWYPSFVEDVTSQRRARAVQVHIGAEIAAADYHGRLKADPAVLGAELVLGVVHRFPSASGDSFWAFNELTAEDAVELEIRALLGLTRNRRIDVLGHPGGTSFTKYGPFPIGWLEDVFAAARDRDIAVELNSKYVWDLDGTINLLRRTDPLVSFGSDAHSTREVGAHIGRLKAHFAREAPALTS